MPEMDIRKVSAWIEEVAASHSRRVGNLNYLFVDDEEILVANRQFVNHDYYTDIITFDYSRGECSISSASTTRVPANAR